MGTNFYKVKKIFDNVIVMRQLKNRKSSRVLAEHLKTVQQIFTKLMLVFRESHIEVFEIKKGLPDLYETL